MQELTTGEGEVSSILAAGSFTHIVARQQGGIPMAPLQWEGRKLTVDSVSVSAVWKVGSRQSSELSSDKAAATPKCCCPLV